MKKMLFIIALFLGFNANGQSYKIIGDTPWINAMFYFEVVDSYNGAEISGVRVDLLDGKVKVASVYTNSRGAALFMIKGTGFIEYSMTFKIQKENYSPWNQTLGTQYDVLEYMKSHQIGIRYRNNQGLSKLRKPTSNPADIAQILNGNFANKRFYTASYSRNGPGMMQFRVSLSYDRHPSQQRGY